MACRLRRRWTCLEEYLFLWRFNCDGKVIMEYGRDAKVIGMKNFFYANSGLMDHEQADGCTTRVIRGTFAYRSSVL